MTATDHLSPQQFFHGTSHEFAPGDMVQNSRGSVYAANDIGEAAMYGHKVYQVEPTGPMQPDPEYVTGKAVLPQDTAFMSEAPMRVVRDATADAGDAVKYHGLK